MKETVLEKLKVLAESAKYDVSCASSGVTRKHRAGGVGLSLTHLSEPTRLLSISYAVFCL